MCYGKTSANFTFLEKQILIRLLYDYKHIVEDKRTDKRTNKEKEKVGTEFTDRFNSEADVSKRTKKQLDILFSILFYPITLEGRRGTTDEFATIPFHLDLFSAALVELAKSIPVHSLILSYQAAR